MRRGHQEINHRSYQLFRESPRMTAAALFADFRGHSRTYADSAKVRESVADFRGKGF